MSLHINSIATMYGATDPRRQLLASVLSRADRADVYRPERTLRADGYFDSFEEHDLRRDIAAGRTNLRPAEIQAASVLFEITARRATPSSSEGLSEAQYMLQVFDPALDFSGIRQVMIGGVDRTSDVRDLVERLVSTTPGQSDGVDSVKVGELIRALHDPWILPEEGPLLVAALDLLVRREVLCRTGPTRRAPYRRRYGSRTS